MVNVEGFIEGAIPREVGSDFLGDKIYGIRPDVASHIGYKFGPTSKWGGPIVMTYQSHEVVLVGGKAQESDMLVDSAIIIEPWKSSELNDGQEEERPGETAFGIVVLEADSVNYSRIPAERRARLYKEFGVVPLDSDHVLFQGMIRDVRPEEPGFEYRDDSLVFRYVPKDWARGEGEVSRLQEERQRGHALKYLLKRHPKNLLQTPLEMLVSQ